MARMASVRGTGAEQSRWARSVVSCRHADSVQAGGLSRSGLLWRSLLLSTWRAPGFKRDRFLQRPRSPGHLIRGAANLPHLECNLGREHRDVELVVSEVGLQHVVHDGDRLLAGEDLEAGGMVCDYKRRRGDGAVWAVRCGAGSGRGRAGDV